MAAQDKYILWFNEVGKESIPYVGGKGANLGEMVSFNIPVPPGFIVTSQAYFYFLDVNDLKPQIKDSLRHLNLEDPRSFEEAATRIQKMILQAKIPKDLSLAIMKAYLELGYPREVLVAVRSSATAEDLPKASFAGQQATFLNISGEANVLKRVHECWASLFGARAIFYREQQQFDHLKVGVAVPVQEMVQSETSGVMFTTDPVTSQKNHILIEAVYGLGEMIVQGAVTPDRFVVNKGTMKIVSKTIARQTVQLIKNGKTTKEVKVSKEKQQKQKVTNSQVIEIAKIGKKIQQHYFFPQDIEWAIAKGKVYILQTRPITTLSENEKTEEKQNKELLADKKVILAGTPASPGLVTGAVRILHSPREIDKIKKGEVLVTSMTTPDFVPAMKKAVAIVTDRGGQTSHAAIVSRELGVPCVVGTEKATKELKNGQIITVNGQSGEIYKGGLERATNAFGDHSLNGANQRNSLASREALANLKTATKIYVNLAEPELASEVAKRNVDGVGLLRAEFMMAQIGIHPKKLIHDRKQKVFINSLVEGLENFCEHFDPRPVVYRASDFKTNEYSNLVGGKAYEPQESNPMLGFRGAYRYLSDPAVFELELQAIKKVRPKYKNLHMMVPFIHTPGELFQVKKIIASEGLLRSSTFKLWMMVEIPSNVILLEDFIKVGIDGVSIGSNDLTMLLLGVDRDNSEVAPVFNELDPAVSWALEKTIKTCHKYKVTSSICGQAPSVYRELLENLVEWGVTSISVNPDVIESTRKSVYEAETQLVKKHINSHV